MNDNDKQSGFYLLSDNTDAFIARLALASIAKKTLDIQYYIMHKDASGQHLAYAILAAADRGVKVRILVDDINLSGRDSQFKALSQHDNIQIRIFNPLRSRNWFRNIELIINLDRAGRRMHNKAFISDNSAAIIGGRNIGDEYFDARHTRNFVDLDLFSVGPIVDDISISFNDYWDSHWATPIESLSAVVVVKKQLTHIRSRLKDRWHHTINSAYFRTLEQADLTQKIINKKIPFIWADARLFYDRPEKLNRNRQEKTIHFGPHIKPYLENASQEILMASPYFVPGSSGVNWFNKKCQHDIKIKVLTNSLATTDVIAVHAGYKKYRTQLLKDGVELYELKPSARRSLLPKNKLTKASSTASLHAKYMILDRRYVFIGSANIDPRSKNLNTEIGIMVDSKELAKQTSELFNRTTSLENSYRLSLNKKNNTLLWLTREHGGNREYKGEPNAGFLRKLGVFILSLLPIEDLL
ncbi:MAG: phospholipase D family protein [Proteobacteria bacterium]|nr:phospholipase D family protein [Pseudomonadota bacterium]